MEQDPTSSYPNLNSSLEAEASPVTPEDPKPMSIKWAPLFLLPFKPLSGQDIQIFVPENMFVVTPEGPFVLSILANTYLPRVDGQSSQKLALFQLIRAELEANYGCKLLDRTVIGPGKNTNRETIFLVKGSMPVNEIADSIKPKRLLNSSNSLIFSRSPIESEPDVTYVTDPLTGEYIEVHVRKSMSDSGTKIDINFPKTDRGSGTPIAFAILFALAKERGLQIDLETLKINVSPSKKHKPLYEASFIIPPNN